MSLAGAALADLDVGSPRTVGMAGAGVALAGDAAGVASLNPALLGAASRPIGLQWPVARWRVDAVRLRDGRSMLGGFSAGALRPDRLGRYAAKHGDRRSNVGREVVASVSAAGFAVGTRQGTWASATPNAALAAWVRGGRDPDRLTGRERMDAYGYSFRSVEASYGARMRLPAASPVVVTAGATLRRIETRYAHRTVTSRDLRTRESGLGPEMGGEPTLSGVGWGLDLGVWAQPTSAPEFAAGAVVRNLGVAGTSYLASPPGNSPARRRVDPFATSVDVGLAYQGGRGWAIAADAVDLTRARGPVELRLGVEKRTGEIFALRGGYSSRDGFVVGGSVGAFSVVFRGRGPFVLQSAFRF